MTLTPNTSAIDSVNGIVALDIYEPPHQDLAYSSPRNNQERTLRRMLAGKYGCHADGLERQQWFSSPFSRWGRVSVRTSDSVQGGSIKAQPDLH